MIRRALLSAAIAAVVVALIWVVGGPLGALLNAPGLMLLALARKAGISKGPEPSLRVWIGWGTVVSAVFWWGAACAAFAATDRRSAGAA